ncbi:MAG TPA: hypothetical protein VFB95_13460, partial [Candidatus Cryosericum sp.]|nr:hypothetical protein [Candidatus Cryosericum sp.]
MSRNPADRRRLLVLIGLLSALPLVLLAAPAMLAWASRPTIKEPTDESAAELRYQAEEARRLSAVPLPPGHMPLPENSPFGGAFRAKRASGDAAKGML